MPDRPVVVCRVEGGIESCHSPAVKPDGAAPVMFAGSLTKSLHSPVVYGVAIAKIPPDPLSVTVGEVPAVGSPPPTHDPPCLRIQTLRVAESTAHSVRKTPTVWKPIPEPITALL